MKREIHIWDLPINKVYINLKKEFRENLFKKAKAKFGNWSKLGNYLGIKRGDSIIAYNWKNGTNCFPLEIALKICNIVNLSKFELEKNISIIRSKTNLNKRGGNSGKSIINPKLPVRIKEDFIEILGHVCGDGSIVTKNPKKGIPFSYINSEPKLIENFRNLMENVFGGIEAKIYIRDEKPKYRKPNYSLKYPTIVSLFVLSVFDYKTGDNMFLPRFINKLNKKEICVFLRALYDDEGTVYEKKIRIGMKPKKVMKDVKRLLNKIGIKTGKISVDRKIHRIDIGECKSIKKFKELIGFRHPKKIKRLNNIIKIGWKFERYSNNEAKKKILELLKNNWGLKVNEISKILRRNKSTIQEHLNKLKYERKIFNKKVQQRVNNTNTLPNLWFISKD